ncbi:hypothetical protein DYU11_20035 [Fibrisoma montanum]|uniref:Uncharacterized protein n=1 Tax=Fibrisoma montanum TaxID=2305895 RepID=A0A418M3X0_9BACT|nr:hypothetical protein [Fibrisoma montanum]RIV20343.1 hypothetical protein DYU11_20035 [Fibrisoma montanum]
MKTIFARFWAYVKASYQRLSIESPKYWRKLRGFFLCLSGVSAVLQPEIVAVVNQYHLLGFEVPTLITDVARMLLAFNIGAAAVTKFAIDPDAVSRATYEKLSQPTQTNA